MRQLPKIDTNIPLQQLNERMKGTMAELIGIEYIEIHEDFLKARMPVDERTFQPLKMLNGGASLALSETLGSMAANLLIDRNKYVAFGMEINANHLKPAKEGYVYGTARPYHVGKSSQVWDIDIRDEVGDRVCVSRLTMTVVEIKDDGLRL
ncbi:MAG: hotdog fold thioesterase [Bacteroidetes bacterium]|nr:hotdog fold thioesterase [Bacteroidota bacterium]